MRAPDGRDLEAGEVPVHRDGSFLATVPADRPLGFEVLDGEGRVLRRLPPFVWLRPGEIRACPGCHGPHGMAPRNRRPLAVVPAPAGAPGPEVAGRRSGR